MESKFPERVELERRALDLVNGSIVGSPSLPGLSYKAVSRWVRDLRGRVEVQSLARLESALRIVAEAARSEADISDEIFVDIDSADAAEAIKVLETAIAEIKLDPGG